MLVKSPSFSFWQDVRLIIAIAVIISVRNFFMSLCFFLSGHKIRKNTNKKVFSVLLLLFFEICNTEIKKYCYFCVGNEKEYHGR